MKPILIIATLFICSFCLQADWVKLNNVVSDPKLQDLQVIQDHFVGREFNTVVVSQNGREWLKKEMPFFGSINNITWGNGYWVVNQVIDSDYPNHSALVSSDLDTWHMSTLPGSSGMSKIVFGSGYFWVRNQDSGQWFQSLDATNWTPIAIPFTEGDIDIVAFKGNAFAIRRADTRVYGDVVITLDGQNWTALVENGINVSPSLSNYLDALAVLIDGQRYEHLLLTYVGSLLHYWDGVHTNWVTVDPMVSAGVSETSEDQENITQVLSSNDSIIVATSKGRLLASQNAEDWVEIKTDLYPISFNDSIVSKDGDLYYTSDGDLYLIEHDLDQQIHLSDSCGVGLSFSAGRIIHRFQNHFFTQSGHRILKSQDGQHWETVLQLGVLGEGIGELKGSGIIRAQLASSERGLILIGLAMTNTGTEQLSYKGFVFRSSDGTQWEFDWTTREEEPFYFQDTSGESYGIPRWISLVYGGDKWVCSTNGSVFYSEQGITWSSAVQPDLESSGNIDLVFYDGEQFVGAGNQNFFHSVDGSEWTATQTVDDDSGKTRYTFNSFVHHNDSLYAAEDNRVFKSEDGFVWRALNDAERGPDYLQPEPKLFDFKGDLFLRYYDNMFRYDGSDSWIADSSLPKLDDLMFVDESVRYVIKRYNLPGLWIESDQLPKSQVKIERSIIDINSDSLAEGEQNKALCTVTRFGNLDQPLEVDIRLWGDAVHGVDYVSNLQSKDENFFLDFSAGQSTLNIHMSAFEDFQVEGNEYLFISLLESDDYVLTEGETCETIRIYESTSASVN